MDLFAAIPKDARRARLGEYLQYLREHDGEINVEERTLSRREAAMKRFESPPELQREIDEAMFRKQYASFDKSAPLGEELLLLLSLVKVNAAEAYGVNRTFGSALQRALDHDDDGDLRVLLQEGYHTRLLLSSAHCYGIAVDQPYIPPSAIRGLVSSIAFAPALLAKPLTLASEIVGTLLFLKLIDVTERVLKDAPETRDALLERISQICVDERGHISYNRLRMGPFELAQARRILPITARVLYHVLPEMVALGAFPINLSEDLRLLTDPKRRRAHLETLSFVA